MGTPETSQLAHAATLPWWKRTTVYQVYPRSFADSNGDGIGDLRGLLGKLDYLRDLGVETLWLSPFFESPQADFGYDISDHYGIAPEYGTLEECEALIHEVHARGMKIVFDMVLNHTSDKHPWFLESRSGPGSAKRDFYLWRKGRGRSGKSPPNNWRSMLGGSGWHRDAESGEWYFASFLPCQPDLNYRNPKVKAAMLDVVRHWLGRGVDGLRLDIFNAIFKDESYADNPFSDPCRRRTIHTASSSDIATRSIIPTRWPSRRSCVPWWTSTPTRRASWWVRSSAMPRHCVPTAARQRMG
jgi:alpha-glucosidase